MDKIGRNDPCPCGSGKKYKKCCLPLLNPNMTVIDKTNPTQKPILDKPSYIPRNELSSSQQQDFDKGVRYYDIDALSPAQKAMYYKGFCPINGEPLKKHHH